MANFVDTPLLYHIPSGASVMSGVPAVIFSSWEKREVKVWRRQSCIRFVLSGASDVPPKPTYKAAARGHLMFLRSIKVVWFVLLSESLNVSHLPLICITSLPRIRLIVHYVYGKYVTHVNPKHEAIHKPLALCLSLLTSIGPFSAPQVEYSAYAYSIHKQPCNRIHNFFNFSDLEVFCNSVAD